MDDRRALEAVLADPDSDEARLRYASAIEATDPARAELIRAQCELVRVGEDVHGPAFDADRRDALEKRAARLVGAHGSRWAGTLATLAKAHRFRRGFVEWAELTADELVARGEELFRDHPVLHVDLPNAAGRIQAVAASPNLRRVRSLSLAGAHIGDAGARALAGSPHAAGLVWLDLIDTDLGAEGIEALAASPNVRGVKFIALSHNRAPDPREQPRHDFDGSIATVEEPPELAALEARHGRVAWLHIPQELYAFSRWPPNRFALR